MKFSPFIWTALPVALSVGCVCNHRYYSYATPGIVIEPTSYSTAARVYPKSTSTRIAITPGETDGLRIANSIANILASSHLYRNVDVSIVKGIVSLRGTVPREQDSQRLYDEITAVPGVTLVENQLGLTNLSM
jgi:Predicted periplasmic or secreted lipoprotein